MANRDTDNTTEDRGWARTGDFGVTRDAVRNDIHRPGEATDRRRTSIIERVYRSDEPAYPDQQPSRRDWNRSYLTDRRSTEWGDPHVHQRPRAGQFAGRGPKTYTRSDERILDDVCELFTRHPDLDPTEVSVSVDRGTVLLKGTVPEKYMKHLSEDIALEVPGVVEVENHLRVT